MCESSSFSPYSDIDECAGDDSNPCLAFQWCENRPGGFKCFCNEGYKLEPETGKCVSGRKPTSVAL